MMAAVKEFLRDWVRLLYWVFFKPTALRAHINQIAPGYVERLLKAGWTTRSRSSISLHALLENPALRSFAMKALLVITSAPFAFDLAIGLLVTALGGDFNWEKSLRNTMVVSLITGVVLGVFSGAMGGMTWGVTAGVTFGLGFGVIAGVLSGMRGVTGSVVITMVLIVSLSTAFSIGLSVMMSVMAGLMLGLSLFVVRGAAGNPAFLGAGGALLFGICATRLPLYVFESAYGILAYRRRSHSSNIEHVLLRSPVYFDEFIFFPQPYLSSLLLQVLQQDLNIGLKHAAHIVSHPYQSWAAQRALKAILAQDQVPFLFMLDRLLVSPHPHEHLYLPLIPSYRYHTTLMLLAEIAGLVMRGPRPGRIERALMFLLKTREESQYARFASVYFDLLDAHWEISFGLDSKEESGASKIIERYSLNNAVATFEGARELPYGEEFYQSLRLTTASLHCETLQHITRLRDEFAPLFEIDDPLRPRIVTVFRRLRDAAIDAASFLTAAHEIMRRDALLKAQGVLEEARRLADEVYEPEHSLLLAVIEHWRRMFAVEGGSVAERAEVETLPNPYVAGRPIRPEDGRLFAGRRDEFLTIEEKLQTGVGLVIYGQRRIGKSSILLHLRERLPHSLLPVYLNLQQLMANTTGGFLRAVGNEIVKQLSDKLDVRSPGFSRKDSETEAIPPEGGTTNPLAHALPSAEEFDREPFLSLNRLMDEIEHRLAPGQRVLLSFDEFEELEQRVKAGKIEKEIFTYLRGVTQTGRGFALLFAGLHTLEQMTREYWNPFFQSVQTVRIGYLSELDARQLITDPIDRFPLAYDEEAIDRIVAVTNSHPYLMQSVCHNLVNRLNDPLHRDNRAKVEDVEAVLEKTLETSGYYFDDYVWGWSNADERVALSLLAEAGEWAGFTLVEKHLGRDTALDATRSLVARSILDERTERGELVFRFQIPLSRMWAQRMKPSARILMEGGRL